MLSGTHGAFSGQGSGCLQTVVRADCYIHLLPAGIGALVNGSLAGTGGSAQSPVSRSRAEAPTFSEALACDVMPWACCCVRCLYSYIMLWEVSPKVCVTVLV